LDPRIRQRTQFSFRLEDSSMNRIVGGILVLGLGLSVFAAEDQGQERPATPAEQFKALQKEYQKRQPRPGVHSVVLRIP
jgi:hypothetical protein